MPTRREDASGAKPCCAGEFLRFTSFAAGLQSRLATMHDVGHRESPVAKERRRVGRDGVKGASEDGGGGGGEASGGRSYEKGEVEGNQAISKWFKRRGGRSVEERMKVERKKEGRAADRVCVSGENSEVKRHEQRTHLVSIVYDRQARGETKHEESVTKTGMVLVKQWKV